MGLVPSGRFKRILRDAAVSPEAWSDARLEQVWEQFDHGTQRALLRIIRDAAPERLERAGADLSEIWAPALVVWGEADPWLPVGFAHRYAGALPRAQLRIVPGSRALAVVHASRARQRDRRLPRVSRRALPTLVAGTFALAYVIIAPRSADLAAELLRARLFGAEGFGLWSNWWYGGHYTLSYSVLFPALAWLATPQLVAAIAVTASAAAFEALAYGQFGEDALAGQRLVRRGHRDVLLSGRLAFAAGLAPALAAALALQRRAPLAAATLARLLALLSPVAALFAALAGAATALGSRSRAESLAGAGVVAGALAPVAVIAVVFGDGGREPFALSAFWPIPLLAVGGLLALAPEQRTLRAGVVLYALGCAAAYLFVTPVGGNAARLAALLAGPLAALLWWPRRSTWLLLACGPAALPAVAGGGAGCTRRGWRPVDAPPPTTGRCCASWRSRAARRSGSRSRSRRATGRPTRSRRAFALARGWERQLDERDNQLFYDGQADGSALRGMAALTRRAVRRATGCCARLLRERRRRS